MHIRRFDEVPGLEDPDFWVIRFEADLWRRMVVGLYGSADLGDSAERRWAWSSHPRYARFVRLVAFDGDDPLGVVSVELPQTDNRHIAYLELNVDADHRRRGVGSALYDAALALAVAEGRTNLQGWAYDAYPATGEERLRGSAGDGEINADSPTARFALARGFKLMQVDLMSAMTLAPPAELDRLAAEARTRTPADYETVQWVGAVPERWRGDMADLGRAMSTDTPTGGAELEEEEFDEERVAAYDRSSEVAGLQRLTTAALHRPSGHLVGSTLLVKEPGKDEVADQWSTIVRGEHRGNGLGMLLKTESHRSVGAHWPAVRRLITGNASENEHMLRINQALGYAPFAASGWYELKDIHGAQ